MLKSAPVCWVGGIIPKPLKASAISDFLETLGMGTLERERPSAGSNGLCSVKSVLLQEKKSAFWGLEPGRAGLLPTAL